MQSIRINIGIFLILSGVFLLTTGGHIYVKDGGAMFFMTESLVTHHWFDVPLNANTLGGRIGPDGRYYTPFGILQPVLAIPFYLSGRAILQFLDVRYLPALTTSLFNVFITALLFVYFFKYLTDLGVSVTSARRVTLGAAVSTPFWVYSATFFSEPFTALAILAAARNIFLYQTDKQLRHITFSGLWMVAMLLTRPLAGIALPVLFLYLVTGNAHPGSSRNKNADLKPIFIFLFFAALGISLILLYNHVRFGSILETGYDRLPSGRPRNFTLAPLTGLKILLFSPGKSIFIFCPLLVPALLGAWLWLKNKNRHPELVLSLLMPTMFLAVLCRWERVEGGVTWGPRLMLPAVPVALVALTPLLTRKIGRGLIIVATLFGVTVQFAGVAVNFSTFISDHYPEYFNSRNGIYRFSFNPIPAHYKLLLSTATPKNLLRKYPPEVAASHKNLVEINYGTQDGPDFWWLYFYRERTPIPFIVTGMLFQCFFIILGLKLAQERPWKTVNA